MGRSSLRAAFAPVVLATALACAWSPAQACFGDGCINIYSTAAGSGALTTTWDFATREMPVFEVFCVDETCLFNAIDPGFIAGFPPAPEGFHPLEEGTRVSFEVIAQAAGASIRINGEAVDPGSSALIGTSPDLHNHPAWQLRIPEGDSGDYELQFRLTTDSPAYEDSQTFTARISNLPPATATPAASPTPTVAPKAQCPGDCNDDGSVSIAELVRGVDGSLGGAGCAAFDRNDDGAIAINELILAVNAALEGCTAGPSPTPTLAATLGNIQASIFSPRCATAACHDATTRSGNLSLEDGASYNELVGVEPDIEIAREAGLLRVDPEDPENSFLLIKLEGPPPSQGSRMPQIGPPLEDAEIDLIRAWIVSGAAP